MSRLPVVCLLAAAPLWAQEAVSPWRFAFEGPLPRWKDGLPVGNGRLGAQVWGSGRQLHLTLDRGDVWDLRYQPNRQANFTYARLQALVKAKNRELIQSEMTPDTGPLSDLTPTRISIGRLLFTLPAGSSVEWAELDMKSAQVRWQLSVGGKPVLLRVLAADDPELILVVFSGADGWSPEVKLEPLAAINRKLVEKLGYPPPVSGGDGEFSWVVQTLPESGRVATMWATQSQPDLWSLLLAIPPQDDPDVLATARRTLREGLRRGPRQLTATHHERWRKRWARSEVSLPDPEIERLWINGLYKLASSSYRGAPTNLQGLWPPDGEIPPWRGDYHGNMNVQETYWPAYSSNQLDLVEPLNRWLFENVAPEAEELTQRFFGTDGIWIGTALDLKGRLLGGRSNWMTVQYWLGAGGWLGQHLWWYYSFSQDREYLRARGYPLMKKLLLFYENILAEGADGRLHVPLSSSPEFFSNELEAWTGDPTGDLSLIRNLIRYTIRASETLGVDEEKRKAWRLMDERLAPYPQGRTGLKVQPDADYFRSHRHPMHLFPIFPGEDLHVEASATDRELIERSIREWIFRGTGEWTGWSFPYGSLIASRVRRAEHALNLLEIYKKAFIWPNGFHVNGDYKRLGFSTHEYEPFTVEGECAFAAAVNEMLLQSWGGRLRIFPAVPRAWKDVSFHNLRAEGGVLVSAQMRRGRVVSASVVSEAGGEIRLVWPLGPVSPGEPFEERVLKLEPGERRELL